MTAGRKKDNTLRLAVKAIHELDTNLTMGQICEGLNCSITTVYNIYRELGIIPTVGRGAQKGHPPTHINIKQRKAIVELRNNNRCATLQEIGDKFNLTRERVRQILKSESQPTAHFIQRYYCLNCDKIFIPKWGSGKMFCSKDCYMEYSRIPQICDNCGRLFYRRKNDVLGIQRYKTTNSVTTCSRKCRGEYYKGKSYTRVSTRPNINTEEKT